MIIIQNEHSDDRPARLNPGSAIHFQRPVAWKPSREHLYIIKKNVTVAWFWPIYVKISSKYSKNKESCKKLSFLFFEFYVNVAKHRTLKNSLHWMLGHVADLIGMNNGYSLAEVSENSLEASIKRYRYITQNLSRQTNFQDNSKDCLKVMFILSSWRIRRFVKRDPSEHDLKDDEDSVIIETFFVNGSCNWQG